MYSDTHFHFKMMSERLASSSESVTSSSVIASLLERDCFFALDIGTECEDLSGRVTCVEKAISFLNEEQKSKAKKMIHFSAGIWPSEDAIKNRFSQMEQLKKSIECANVKISAIGECGIDHFRNSENFDKNGEHELFEM
ncbi:MAG: TatD family hydrolase, partial [Treponema sp.]|nr:TatD family hydrolase [Treponema sp.]